MRRKVGRKFPGGWDTPPGCVFRNHRRDIPVEIPRFVNGKALKTPAQ